MERESIAYFKEIINSKAFEILSLPEKEIENFLENYSQNDLITIERELNIVIKELKRTKREISLFRNEFKEFDKKINSLLEKERILRLKFTEKAIEKITIKEDKDGKN